jgi:hypothetical protein
VPTTLLGLGPGCHPGSGALPSVEGVVLGPGGVLGVIDQDGPRRRKLLAKGYVRRRILCILDTQTKLKDLFEIRNQVQYSDRKENRKRLTLSYREIIRKVTRKEQPFSFLLT